MSTESFDVTMNTDKLVRAECSCDYKVTVINDGCTVDWTGEAWFDAGEHTCVSVGTNDPAHCYVETIRLDGTDLPADTPIVYINNIQANHEIITICRCKYNVTPSTPNCIITPAETQQVMAGGSVTFTIEPAAANCWISSILQDFVSVGNTNPTQTISDVHRDHILEAYCECEEEPPVEPPSGGFGCETAYAY